MENHFNLLDEPWIPVADVGRVSLREIFSRDGLRELGGNPIQKLALTKLLLSIAQAACTPADETEWADLGAEGLASRCLDYLETWHGSFYLHGERPFLQMPAVADCIAERTERRLKAAKTKGKRDEVIASGAPRSFGAGFYPDMPSANNTLLSHTLFEKPLDTADQAVFLVTLMNFAFGGKRVEGDLTSLAGRALGNRYSAPAAPSLGGWVGQLHCLVTTGDLRRDIWVNLMTREAIEAASRWPDGVGRPVWEAMPTHEADDRAESLKRSYQGCLVALSRFALLQEGGIYYLDGINYPGIKDGWYEPSLLLDQSGKDIKVKYVNLDRKPWRELHAFLDFLTLSQRSGFESLGLQQGVSRMRDLGDSLCVWTGGLKVSANSGDQSVKQADDFLESKVWLQGELIDSVWLTILKREMEGLEQLGRMLYACVRDYYRELKATPDMAAAQAARAGHLYWQLCERDFSSLTANCEASDADVAARRKLRERFFGHVRGCFEQCAPRETARQLEAWARHQPRPGPYLATPQQIPTESQEA
ncbi:type I-E CRISPR-associated protein Cse1/CasA [Halomonas sp. BC04]|uniref:type I-E CRISPR-associated protein Cse1/CasA n=1 Tax=Halomonas sp. BC04 TaxID=1403540 RepID=UPI0003ED5C20|nr:type I-E CRISPR-associated protein Cse1/CasA [Halomonas sp. BC04]EWH00589.1 CRISPR-associated protein Cse1 [Halomonas sp. BC04]